jgi:hypothetical protein
MNNESMYDYEQVCVLLNEAVIDPLAHDEQVEPDLSFSFGSLKSALPVVFFYSSLEPDQRTEEMCERAGVLTCGAVGSKIPFLAPELVQTFASSDATTPFASTYLYEVLDPTTSTARTQIELISKCARNVVVGCSLSARHGKLLVNELRTAAALLVGPTMATTFKDIDTLGMATPRVSLVQDLSRATDVPIFVTAASASETCKALVAGADAVVINIGGPFAPDEDVEFIISTVSQSLRDNLERLCRLAHAKTVSELQFRCRLTSAR